MVMQLFISHSYKDISLARFLIHLLSFYQIDAWTSFIDPRANLNSQRNLDKVLLNCDNLLVLITENTLTSRLVTSEILIFKKVNPYAEIVPLIFDSKVDVDQVVPGWRRDQVIDFSHDLTSGFRSLFARYGIDFLTHVERRQRPDRRKGKDRRQNSDRRSKNITRRLHRTFIECYLENNGASEENDIDLNDDYELRLLMESIKQGAKNYLCYDEIGTLYNSNFVAELCFNQTLASLAGNSTQNSDRYINPPNLTFAIAKNMTTRFIVKCRDRRKHRDRRSGGDRRMLGKTLSSMAHNLN